MNEALVAEPPADVNTHTPVAALLGTTATKVVDDTRVNAAATPANVAPLTEPRFVPVTSTAVPGPPLVTDSALVAARVGAAAVVDTVKLVALVAVLHGVVTTIAPVAAPVGTPRIIDVADTTWNAVTATPPIVTPVAPHRLVPVSVTVVPRPPLDGVNDVIAAVADPVAVAVTFG